MMPTDIARRFSAHANLIGLNLSGLTCATLYRDSQFEMECRRVTLTDEQLVIARQAFNLAFDERIVREFSRHPYAAISASRLSHAKA